MDRPNSTIKELLTAKLESSVVGFNGLLLVNNLLGLSLINKLVEFFKGSRSAYSTEP